MYSEYNSTTTNSSPVMSALFYILIVIFIILFVLIIIHFTYKPIFSGRLLSGDSGKIFWENEKRSSGSIVSSNEAAIGNRYCEYSLCFDMIIDDPLNGTGSADRLLLRRGAGDKNNFTMALDKELNDLIIKISTVENTRDTVETFVIENLPTDKGFTIGFVLSETFAEIYLNGRLYSTRTFSRGVKLKDNLGNFIDSLSGQHSRTKRLRIWNSVVTASTMRTYADTVSPPFTPKSSYVAGGSCSAD
jgi:hypothetical protein